MRQKGDARGRLFEVIPASVALPMRPVIDEASLSERNLKALKAAKLQGPTTTIEEAQANTKRISDEFRQRFLAGDREAWRHLLDVNPEFIREPWVADALISAYRAGRLFERKRGRPRGPSHDTWFRGLIIVALVEALARKDRKSREAVLQDLSDGQVAGLYLSYQRLKNVYYEMRSDPRLRSLLFADEARCQVMTEEELNEYLTRSGAILADGSG